MCWYLWEPRSKDYADEDDLSGEQGSCLSNILLLPLLPVALVGLLWVSLTPLIALFLYYLADIYKTTKETMQSGEMAYPFLANLGILVIGYLYWAVDIDFFPVRFVASVFVFNHTLLPYAAVLIYKLSSFCCARGAG